MRVVCTGGAGFVGSTLVRHLLADPGVEQVTVFDNFSTGERSHLHSAATLDPMKYPLDLSSRLFVDADRHRLTIVDDDAQSQAALVRVFKGHDVVIHLAANSQIQKATEDPDLDYRNGTLLTRNVLEAMRITGVKRILFASSGGAYGDYGGVLCTEEMALKPIAPYGAAKAAGEALLHAYAHLFGFSCFAFRFCNVTGPRQTHGIVHDFLVKLRRDPSRLTILGDGTQRKSYIHVDDVARGMLYAANFPETLKHGPMSHMSVAPSYYYEPELHVFNLTTTEEVTVDQIANLAMDVLGLPSLVLTRGKENRGWAGDVPVVRLSGAKLASLGWKPQMESRDALRAAFEANR